MDINSLIVYGHPGYAKSFTVAKAMSDALWLVTRKSNVSFYNSWLRANPEEARQLGCQPIDRSIISVAKLVAGSEGDITRADVRGTVDDLVKGYVAKANRGETKVRGIVIDELSVMAKWTFEALKDTEKNGFEVISKIKDWVGGLCEISELTGLPLAFICHQKDPSYWEDGPKKGNLKYKGGPAMPVGSMIGDVCALPDAVFQMDMQGSGRSQKLVLKCGPDRLWERKCRVWGVEPEMEPDLHPVLMQGGWDFKRAPVEKQ